MKYTEDLIIETHNNLKKLEQVILDCRFFAQAVKEIAGPDDLQNILERQQELLEEHERKNT